MTLEERVRTEIEAWCAHLETWLGQESDPQLVEIESLLEKAKDATLRKKIKEVTAPKTVRAVCDLVKFNLTRDLGAAYRKWRSFENDRQFVEGMLSAEALRRGRKNIRATSKGGKERWKADGWKRDGQKWQRVIDAGIKKGRTYPELVRYLAREEGCHAKTVRRYTKDPTKNQT